MSEMVNPYIAGSPVSGTEMFFGREDVFTFIRETLTGRHRDNVIVLYGQRRTGKTSVLYQMSRHLGEHYVCVFIDLHGLALEGLSGFIWELANSIARTLRRDYKVDLPRLNHGDFAADPRSFFENDFLSQVWSALGDRHILLMLDEAIRLQEQIQAGKLEKEVFEYLRHLMQHHERLNFLFSLGSGLEEMEKEYAFLFSVALYKKISFLNREAATALITQPVTCCYQVEPAAVEHILDITSGHAYYTQLLCHSLFNRWQQERRPHVTVADVNAVLDEVVERGLAVLKHVWEESTPGEKAVLAGMAATMGEHNRMITPREIDRAWQQHEVTLPPGEKAKAIKSLIARDVIAGQDKYVFAIDLQRRWVQKYERLDWVKEEIAGDAQRWSQPGKVPRLSWRVRAAVIGAGLVMLIVLGLGISTFVRQSRELAALRLTVTASAREADATATTSALQVQMAAVTRDAAASASAPTAAAAATRYINVAATATSVAGQLSLKATADAQLLQSPFQIAPLKTATPTPIATILPPPTATPGIGSTRVSEKDGMVMVYVNAGDFLMGSAITDSQAYTDEKPQHMVYLDTFWIDRTEVTNAQYKECAQAGVCQQPRSSKSRTRDSYYGDSRFDNYPVIYVSWDAAKRYCEWVGRRLPTEAEWEKAARGTEGRKYPWGNNSVAGNLVNFCDKNCLLEQRDSSVDDGYADTSPGGNYPEGISPYHALDMAGNVQEWVADFYDEIYYAKSPRVNPLGPSSGQFHVLRGGGWFNGSFFVRAAVRRGDKANNEGDDNIGFRCAASP
jgi:formylglycine-generating enzyme required for sulfatase activity